MDEHINSLRRCIEKKRFNVETVIQVMAILNVSVNVLFLFNTISVHEMALHWFLFFFYLIIAMESWER